jgi:hypothetical protein
VTIADDVLLPEGTRLLHIGPQKTGTTTLQGAFHAARRKVERQGVHYASRNRQAKQAARAVGGRPSPYIEGRVPSEVHWTRLLNDVESSRADRVVISAEAFSDAQPAAIRRVVDELDPDTLHIVATLRPLARILPSQWQQYVQNGLARSYDDWLDGIFNSPERLSPLFWHRHRHDQLIRRWAEVVGRERTTVVVVDDRDHESSLRAFERLLGLRTGTLHAPGGSSNRSLTRAEVELVRAMHAAFAKLGIDKGLRLSMVLNGAAENMKLRQPSQDEPRMETPAWAGERVTAVAREIVEEISQSGVRVIGDLERLVEPPKPPSAGDAQVSTDAWSATLGRGLMGVLIETGLTRGSGALAGAAWPDDLATESSSRAPVAKILRRWSTPRLASVVIGRVRSTVPSWLAPALNLLRRLVIGGGRRRRRRAKLAQAGAPSVSSASGQRDRPLAHELEEAE